LHRCRAGLPRRTRRRLPFRGGGACRVPRAGNLAARANPQPRRRRGPRWRRRGSCRTGAIAACPVQPGASGDVRRVNGLVLILRPQPGADETAARARALGLDPVVASLFTVHPRAWQAPNPAAFDAVMLTSANAVRYGGDALTPFLTLPCFAVGEATTGAAREAGFRDIRTGPGDGAALVGMMAAAGVRAAFHPCGEDRRGLG